MVCSEGLGLPSQPLGWHVCASLPLTAAAAFLLLIHTDTCDDAKLCVFRSVGSFFQLLRFLLLKKLVCKKKTKVEVAPPMSRSGVTPRARARHLPALLSLFPSVLRRGNAPLQSPRMP